MNSTSFYKSISQISYIYLVLPFVIFCVGWLNIYLGLILLAAVIWGTYRTITSDAIDEFPLNAPEPAVLLMVVVILGIWVWFSGIGGYAFQNWDHHWRNAVFRDLVTYEWPVIYPAQKALSSNSSVHMLTYYIGFWLPASLFGKILGWEAANAFLFIWSWLGVVLIGFLLQRYFKSRSLVPIILFIFFSGMDIVGMFVRFRINPIENFFFWPPISRIENWTTLIQYSSNSTQLFWIFNQAIPNWLCITLFITSKNNRYTLFLWSICVFYAPMQALGLLPFVLLDIFKDLRTGSGSVRVFDWNSIKMLLKKHSNMVNIISGGSILLISTLYFSQTVASPAGEPTPFNIVLFSIFLLLEGGLLWLLVYPEKRDPLWLLIGFLLFVALFLHNDTFDFGEKITNSILFFLMIAVGDFLFRRKKATTVYVAVTVILLIGSTTAFYEISRSVIKTMEYFQTAPNPLNRWDEDHTATYPILASEIGMEEALYHPGTLVADGIKTIPTSEEAKWVSNYLGDVTNSPFYKYFSKRK